MKIRKLQLKNIGVFDDETIEFQPCPVNDKAEIHIFTGQNGSGKSTLLMSLVSSFDTYENETDLILLKNSLYKRFRQIVNTGKDNIKNQVNVFFDSGFTSNIKIPFESSFQINTYYKGHGGTAEAYNIRDNINLYRKYLTSEQFSAPDNSLSYAVFAFSGYRQIKNEKVEAISEPSNFNPLFQSLDFVKDYNHKNQVTINQLIANNISKSAIEKERNPKKSAKFAKVVSSIEQIINEVTGWTVEFDIQTEPINLVTKINSKELEFDVLPDGLRSLISWVADLLGRVDLLKWDDDLPIFEKNLILLLDEIEVHLHPAWQRKVLPVVQKLFKNSQIFVSTHSPFVVNSIDDAWVYKLELENGKAKVAEVVRSENSNSITQVLREILGIDQWFGLEVQNNFERFKELKNKILSNGADESVEKEFLEKARILADEPNDQLKQIIRKDLEELSEKKKKPYTL